MSGRSTVPARRAGLPLRALKVQVLDGPDQGTAHVSEAEAITVGTAQGNHLQLSDPTVSRFHLELKRQGDRVQVIDHGSTNGVLFNDALIERGSIAAGTVLKVGRTTLKVEDGRTVMLELQDGEALGELKGRSPAMRRVMALVQKVAETDVSVLLCGESGTGKELTARAIHRLSHRSGQPFVTVDCGALAPTLIQSELFGHEKGAFTGADRRHAGAFERAHGGTLFLDEIGELPAAVQATLLGALERRRFRRVGGSDDIAVNVRVVSATNRDVRAEVNTGSFRLDLFYRIAVTVLELPPLRERLEDIPLLVEGFLREAGCDGPVEQLFPAPALEALRTQRWEGNLRELRNLVEATLAMGELPALPGGGRASSPGAQPETTPSGPLMERPYGEARDALIAEFEKSYVAQLLKRSNGNVSLAARTAQVDRTHLLRLIKRHGLRPSPAPGS